MIAPQGILTTEVMPESALGFFAVIRDLRPDHVFLEKAQPMVRPDRKQGASGIFNYATFYGELRGVLTAMAIPFTLVPPQTWQKVVHVGTTGKDSKEKSTVAAGRLFPGHVWLASQRCRVPHLGMVEAALIAEWGRRQLK